jgi:hypothetical protein
MSVLDRLTVAVTFDPAKGYVATILDVAVPVTALSLNGLRRRIEALLMPDSRGRAAGARPRRRARPAAQGRRAGLRTGVAAVGRGADQGRAAADQQPADRQGGRSAGKIR